MKVVITGNYGASNLGDELILEGLLKSIRTIKPAAKITVLGANPQKVTEKFEVKSFRKFPAGPRSFLAYLLNGSFAKTKKAVKECDYFILGGGGLFDDTSLKAIWIWGIQGLFALLYKKKIIMYGQSLRELRSSFAKFIVRKLFKKAVFIAVRDEESKKALKKVIKGKKIYLMPDLLFRLEPKFDQAKENKIIVALRPGTRFSEDIKGSIAEFINNILREDANIKVEFIPFQRKFDENFHSNVIAKITEKDRVEKAKYTEKRHDIERVFSESQILIGMRLHSILMAIMTGTPFIAINYNPKVKNILETLNLQQYLIEPDKATPAKLMTLYKKIQGNSSAISSHLRKIRESQNEKHLAIESHLKKLLD